ncbi:hypothetical protein FGO68_gene11967 [Halteria grandinella]|uniref:Uncharacterized protein n=1 Tax=Halteria grandinella TaxID=5974 RepID=A0A8J8P1C9_HALGN|nr:hypothetical protein FGO68_gene11967 [Halteria grandinella]
MIILRDITELVQKEYHRSMTKLSEIMVASTSHDMRTPLNTIINMHSLIEMKVSNDPDVLHWLQIARSSSNLLLFLVNDTLDYFQIKSGKFKIKQAPWNLKMVAESCFQLISIQMQKKQQEQVLDIDESFDNEEFIIDGQRISQVLVNLLSNAHKFTPKGGYIKIEIQKLFNYPIKRKLVRVKQLTAKRPSLQESSEQCLIAEVRRSSIITPNLQTSNTNLSPQVPHLNHENVLQPSTSNLKDSSDPAGSGGNHNHTYTTEEKFTLISRVKLCIEDNGMGIKEEDKAKLFRMFGKVGFNNEKINPHGIGLGLTICNKILGQMGSELQVESEYGKGTRFYFLLDIQQELPKEELKRLHGLQVAQAIENRRLQQSGRQMQESNGPMQQLLLVPRRVQYMQQEAEQSMIINNENETSQVNLLIKDLKPKHANPEVYHIQSEQNNNEMPETSGRLGMIHFQVPTFNDFPQLLTNNEPKSLMQSLTQQQVQRVQGSSRNNPINQIVIEDAIQSPNNIDIEFSSSSSAIQLQQNHTPTDQISTKCTKCPKILIVDDNAFNISTLRLIIDMCNGKPIVCEEAFNGQEAVDLCKKRFMVECGCPRYYPIIFMDISMPVLDGYQASRFIRELEKHYLNQGLERKRSSKRSFIVGLTAHFTDTYQNHCYDSGMDEYMPKPIDQKNLRKVLCQVLIQE